MSLYYAQKLLYNLNRDRAVKRQFDVDPESVLRGYTLTEAEHDAIVGVDIGLLYVFGVNGQLLMHYATMQGFSWAEYIQAMRDGIEKHGPVRSGLYVMKDGKGAV
jgi:hypothetical protein